MFATFAGLSLEYGQGTYAPHESFQPVAEAAIKWAPRGSRILDVGTGIGTVALAVAAGRGDTSILGVDINPTAAAYAKRNASRLGIGNVRFFVGDLYTALRPLSFDVVTNSLPYEPPETYDPKDLAEVPHAYADDRQVFGASLYYAPVHAPMLILFGLEGFVPVLERLRYEVLSETLGGWGEDVIVARQRG